MQKLTGYMAGANLGGWVSQYRALDHEHFKTFITEKDIKNIASWGMDHIRVPIDYPVIEEDANPGVFLESGFAYLDNSIEWAKKYGLNVVIDVHKAPGFSFNTPDKNTLFSDPNMQDRFAAIWKAIAKRYRAEGDNVSYELLNEIVEPDSTRWNPLAERLIKSIREEDTGHSIIVGGIQYNNVRALALMPIFDDPKIVYNFHMYEPHGLTHQKASWHPEFMEFKKDIHYPSDIGIYLEFLQYFKRENIQNYEGFTRVDKEFLRHLIKPAIDFIEKNDKPMYCGEYGVIDHVDMASRENWSEDLSDLLLEYGIGRAVWTYKGMSFTHIDKDGKPISERLVKAVSKTKL
ncbi:endoglucanase [Spirochaetia bacterium]|nr:endoglucanase [Spirochaetia bacterium]